MLTKVIQFIDRLTGWFGRAFAWLILLMAFGMGYEVLVRYVFNAPTAWAFDMSYILYGTLFMVGGAYTLARNAHVRGDFLYRLWKPRTQAAVELVLYFIFFFPGITALVIAGTKYAARSWRYMEVSVNSPAGVPVFHFKTMLVVAGALLFLQGIAQVCRCILCLRTGEWLGHEEDAEELEDKLLKQAASGKIDKAEQYVHGRDDT
ncbi:membrane protein [Litchfieldella anticariensis FP35 = DSM 16096]|uniref:TRAP transporter small permease protein n=1 Tax=Litchfieldella anticariensis (strain DSM 16096 / CECT 5854 / CIP 108499 / LMG 22089 / FP35) TaxID=1121939 RepID=S2KRC4_LITA3|nr:TRAP transporter small permease subunit [Halomonas anticariensis]EPC03043.1 membrane protein [Halomonas anticariensis FP35 = DSM 16096]